MSTEEIEGLQANCVYLSDQNSCDQLTAAGFGPDGNYGLGNSLTQAPDAALAAECFDGRTLACLEMQTRYVASAADEAVANTFATAMVANDTATAATVAAPYLPAVLAGFTALPEAVDNFQFLFTPGSGFFQVGLGGGVILDCIAAEGLVRLCTSEAD